MMVIRSIKNICIGAKPTESLEIDEDDNGIKRLYEVNLNDINFMSNKHQVAIRETQRIIDICKH